MQAGVYKNKSIHHFLQADLYKTDCLTLSCIHIHRTTDKTHLPSIT